MSCSTHNSSFLRRIFPGNHCTDTDSTKQTRENKTKIQNKQTGSR